jgi:iron complex outermembrane receptor protein
MSIKERYGLPEFLRIKVKYNRNPLYQALKYALVSSAIAGFALVSSPILAQESSDEDSVALDRVQVTGSRLSRLDIEGAAPVTVLDREDIEHTGFTDLGDFLRQMPSMNGSPLGTFSNNPGFTSGRSTVDIRGLGAIRTLVLVDGRRTVDNGDLATIPFNMVERIEILKEGASAIYGADAVAGVVNIITRKSFEGAEVSGQYSQYTELSKFEAFEGQINDTDDGRSWRVSGIMGDRGDRGGFTVGMEYSKQEGVFQGEVDSDVLQTTNFWTTSGGQLTTITVGSSFTPQGRFTVDITDDGVRELVTRSCGTCEWRPYVGGGAVNDTYNYAPTNYIQRPFERRNFFMNGDYELFDFMQAYMSGRFQSRTSGRELAPQPYGPIIGNPGALLSHDADVAGFEGVTYDNYYNPFGQDIFDARRRMVDVGGRSFDGQVDQYETVVGFRGDFGTSWSYDVSYSWGQRTNTSVLGGQFYGPFLSLALGPSFKDEGGDIVCGTPDLVLDGCVPLNLFGGPGTITQEMQDYVQLSATSRTTTEIHDFMASVVGDLWELPAGPLSSAFGYEYRKNKLKSQLDSGIQSGQITGNSGGNTFGDYDVNSLFAEFNVPILSGVTAAEMLEAGLGVRYDDYSTVGSNTSFMGSVRWQPIQSLLLRASYSDVFREPSISELFVPASEGFPPGTDPCSANKSLPGCGGVPAEWVQDGSVVRTIFGGNPNLDPEQGDTYTIGVAWSPQFAPGLSMTVDYWNITLDDAIAALSTQNTLSICANTADPGICALIERFASGDINFVLSDNQNLGSFTREGLDFNFKYTLNSDWGLWKFDLDWTHILKAEVVPFAGYQNPFYCKGGAGSCVDENGDGVADNALGFVDQKGVADSLQPINFSSVEIIPENKVRFAADWGLGDFGISYVMTWIDSIDYICGPGFPCAGDLANSSFSSAVVSTLKVDSHSYHDLFFTYHRWATSFMFGITDLTNEKPPLIDTGAAGTSPETYRMAGRQVLFRVTHDF